MNPERGRSLRFPSDRGGRERKGALGTAGVLRAQVGALGVGEGVLGEEPRWGREQGAGVERGRERQGFPSSN